MNGNALFDEPKINVAIIGGGPSGLAAATALKKRGVARVVVLEREPEAGGIPRHCGHPPFGLREFHRILTGPVYARNLVERARQSGVEIHTDTSVTEVAAGPRLHVITPACGGKIFPERVIYATGVRETPRSTQLIGGARAQGVLNTGALQGMVYLEGRRPFLRPVIVGTELVSFSALQTCAHAGIKPVAMIGEGRHTLARWPSGLFPRLKNVPLHLQTRLISINGGQRVTSVSVDGPKGRREIACDGVLLTGKFTPESSLGLLGHLQIDRGTNGPVVDQFGRCSDPAFYACGNVLRPVETAGWCWQEGGECARHVVADLRGDLPKARRQVPVYVNAPELRYALPQKISLPFAKGGTEHFQLRFTTRGRGFLGLAGDGGEMWNKPVSARPERRMLLPWGGLIGEQTGRVEVTYTSAE